MLKFKLFRAIRNPHFWAIAAIFIVIAIVGFSVIPIPNVDVVQSIVRMLLLVPITYSGFIFGRRGSITGLIASVLVLLPQVIFFSDIIPVALLESAVVLFTGILISVFLYLNNKSVKYYRLADEVLSEIIEGLPIPTFVINNKHQVTHWNTALEELTSIKKGDIIGTDYYWRAFYNEKAPTLADLILEDSTADKIISRYHGEAKKSSLIESAYEAESFFPAIGAKGKWLHFTASLIKNTKGRIVGAIETLEDITERLKAEEALRDSERKFRDLFESASDAIWVHDLEGNIQTANAAATKLTGYTVEELCRSNVKLFLTEESLLRSKDYESSLQSPHPVIMPYEQKVIRKDRSEALCMVTANPITHFGELKAFQNIARDVTEEKRLYENLRYYLREITRAQEEERKRISRELHDSTAQNLIALLHKMENLLDDRGTLPVRQAKALWSYYEEIRDILQEVRRFSRDLRPAILDDLGLLPAIDWLAGDVKNTYGVEVGIKISGSERRLSQDAELLFFRIIQEALRNVTKHSHASSAEVQIAFNDKNVTVTISDDGHGFQVPENLGGLPQIGKLGLAGMMERVQLIGGKLNIKSEPGKGTQVIVEAPV